MDFTQAIHVLRQYGYDRAGYENDVDSARTVVTRAVCDALGISWHSDEAGDLGDWVSDGAYSGDETPESLAAEWREITAE